MRDIFKLNEKPEDRAALLSDEGAMVTYGELQQQAAEMGKAVSERSLMFCMCKNEPGAVVGYLGALGNGLVPLLLDAALQQGQFARFYEIYQPAYIWAPEKWAGRVQRDEGHAYYVKQKAYQAYGYVLWETGCEACPLYPELGLLLATSGSTGDPRIVRLSYRNLTANAASICEYLHLDQSERPITTLPMQYTYGLSVINSHLLAGACVLLTTASLVQKEFWNFLETRKATSFGGVPYTYEILKKIHVFRRTIPSLRTITQAGGRLSPALQSEVGAWAGQQGIAFYVMYGQTEATARMAYLPPEQSLNCPATVKKRNHYSARTAGILGFSLFGTHRTYALRDEDMSLDMEAVSSFLEKFGGQKFLVFGFTYIVWKYLVRVLEEKELYFDMSQAVLVHGGGWKRLENEAVSREEYKKRIAGTCGIEHVMDYYGMAEQSGSVFMECPCGHLHCSDFSAVLVRRPQDFSLCRTGETGLIQVMSVVPKSYPGHSLLTEDEGRILGVDDCPCGRKGVYFEVLGRARHAELRGCSEMAE